MAGLFGGGAGRGPGGVNLNPSHDPRSPARQYISPPSPRPRPAVTVPVPVPVTRPSGGSSDATRDTDASRRPSPHPGIQPYAPGSVEAQTSGGYVVFSDPKQAKLKKARQNMEKVQSWWEQYLNPPVSNLRRGA